MKRVAERSACLAVLGARRAQETGELRTGFIAEDLILMLTAHQGLQHAPLSARLTASRREPDNTAAHGLLTRKDAVVGNIRVHRVLESLPGIGAISARQLLTDLGISVQGL